MRKNLYAFCALATLPLMLQAKTINATDATDADNPKTFTSYGLQSGDNAIFTTSRSNMVPWADYYFIVDTGVVGAGSVYSTGSKGYHANYHFKLNAENNTFSTSDLSLFAFNANGGKVSTSSVGYFFESADGSAVTINGTHADGVSFKLNSYDGNGESESSKVIYGVRGRTVSIGENVTLNATKLKVNGRLVTEQTEYTDSSLEVAGAIKLTSNAADADTVYIENADVNVASTGSIVSAKNVSIQSASKVKVEGSISAANGIVVKASTLDIKAGGTVSQLGTETNSYFSDNSIVNVVGTLSSKNAYSFANSTLNVLAGGSIVHSLGTMPTVFTDTSVNIDGTVFMPIGSYINGGTQVNINDGGKWFGKIVLKGGSIVINSGATVAGGADGTVYVGMANDANSTLTVKDGADISKVSTLDLRGGTLTVTDDMHIASLNSASNVTTGLTVAEGATYSADTTDFKSGSTVVLNGNISLNASLRNSANLTISSGTVSTGVISGGPDIIRNSGVLNVSSGATLYANNANAYAWGVNNSTQLDGTINVNGGTLALSSETTDSYAGAIVGNVAVNNGGKITLSNANTFLSMSSGTLTTDSTARIDVGKGLIFAVGSRGYDVSRTVNVGGKDVFAAGSNIVVIRTINNKVSFASGDSYVFNAIKFHDIANASKNNNVTLDLNGAQVEFTEFTSLGGSGGTPSFGTVIFEDFAAGLVKVSTLTTDLISTGTFQYNGATITLQAYDVGGKLLDGTWSVDDSGYLFNSALVPEPAEWACIFGALALALALYRRRK